MASYSAATQTRAARPRHPKTTQQVEEEEQPAYNPRHKKNFGLYRGRRNYRNEQKLQKVKSVTESAHNKRVGFDASSGFHGDAGERRSSSEDGAFASNVDSLRDDYNNIAVESDSDESELGPARLRNLNGQTAKWSKNSLVQTFPRRTKDQVFASVGRRGGPSQRKPPKHPHTEQRNRCSRLPGIQISDRVMNELMQTRPSSETFESRRRTVTHSEIHQASTAAEKFSSTLNSTTISLVMRKSSVYQNFELDVLTPEFSQEYMPLCNKPVRLVDDDWKVWTCGWNSAANCISGLGWRNFALEHCVEEDDTLLLEMISETNAILTLKVHIFRVVAIREGLTGWKSHICPRTANPTTIFASQSCQFVRKAHCNHDLVASSDVPR